MPPKITDLVKYFEEQNGPVGQRQDRASPTTPQRLPQSRRASAPLVHPSATRVPVRAVPLRSVSSAAVQPILVTSPQALPGNDATTAVTTPKLPAVPKAIFQPPRPGLAPPQTTQTNITNVKASDAAKAISDCLAHSASDAPNDGRFRKQDPPPVRDRFRHVMREKVIPEDTETLLGSRATSVSSARTLVAEVVPEKPVPKRVFSGISFQDFAIPPPRVASGIRPTLPASSSNGKISTYTTDIPAFNVFLPDAKPLQLPLLDEYIEGLPKLVFSEPEQVLCAKEMQGWKEWLATPQAKRTWADKLLRRQRKGAYQRTADQDDDGYGAKPTLEQAKRALIFPPMHRIPPNLTVTDLKHNKQKTAPLVTLNSLLSTAIDAVLGAQGSSYAVSLMRVEAFRDLIQMIGTGVDFAVPSSTPRASSTAQIMAVNGVHSPKAILLSVIPSVLGLDFVSAFGKAILWLWVFTLICFIACWEFKVMVGGWGGPLGQKVDMGEGLDSEEIHIRKQLGWRTRFRQSRTYRMCVVFLLTTLYLPLSKICIGALVWTSDYWAVENYYATDDNPTPAPLGPSDAFRDPLDFCYTTTMRKGGFNWAWPILIVAGLVVGIVTCWFPVRLLQVVRTQVPSIDEYTEMGEKRKDKAAEYERLLGRDTSPFSFIYNEYRKEWAGYKSAYMALKLVNVLCITLITKDNCLFRSRPRDYLNVIRQATLLAFMVAWMVLQIYARPFTDKLSNNSDWCSRIAYVVIAILGLAAALRLPGGTAYNGWLLVTVTAVSYVLNGYFTVLGTGFARQLIKQWQKRLDFSIDIFSPHLDMPKHIARRMQQETISTLLLAEPEYRLKDSEPLVFGTAATSTGEEEAPPYLLAFQGTQGERHIENLKILREIGLQRYVSAIDCLRSPDSAIHTVHQAIQRDYTGPDCFWRPTQSACQGDLCDYFGRATVIPFPFTLVFRYDLTNTTTSITNHSDLAAYIEQNSAVEVTGARRVRLALRALDGKRCFVPRVADKPVSRYAIRRPSGSQLEAGVQYTFATLHVERNSQFLWRGYNYNSGFRIRLVYLDGRLQRADGTFEDGIKLELEGRDLGITPDFSLTSELAQLFRNNKTTLDEWLPITRRKLQEYRNFFAREAAWKLHTLSYGFLVDVYGNDQLDDDKALEEALYREEDQRMQSLLQHHCGTILYMRERMQVNQDMLSQWWTIFWDEIWRRNHSTVKQLETYASDFSPVYRTSICYQPMARTRLEEYLRQRGLWPDPGKKGFFNHGILNRIYFYLDETLFEGTRGGIPMKVGNHHHPVDFRELAQLKSFDNGDSFGRHTMATYDTGQGTDHDESIIRNRPHFLFEEIYDERRSPQKYGRAATIRNARKRAAEGVQGWLGLRPFQRAATPPGLYFSLRDSNGTYKAPRG